MSGMTLICNPSDWESYTQRIAQDSDLNASTVAWGSGPRQYPCLVASIIPSPMKVVSCYVYMDDVKPLLEAAGFSTAQRQGPPAVAHSGLDVAYKKHVAAMLRAIVEELVEVKVTNQERYQLAIPPSSEAAKIPDKDTIAAVLDKKNITTPAAAAEAAANAVWRSSKRP